MKALVLLVLLFTVKLALADTPPPNTVKIKDSAGNSLNSTSGALDVNLTSSGNLAKETGGNLADILAELNTINAKLATLGQKNMAGSQPVVIASDQTALPISGSISATNPSVSANGNTAPVQSTQVGGVDGSGNLQALKAYTDGRLAVDGSASSGQPDNSTSVGTGTAVSFSPPANCMGFILQAESTNTDNIRWSIGPTTAGPTVGMLAEPGRDSGFVPACTTVSAIAMSGTQAVGVIWVKR